MAAEQCQHSNRVRGLVRFDFTRQDAPDGPAYSGAVSVGICEQCGHVEMYAKLHHLLCDWLRKS